MVTVRLLMVSHDADKVMRAAVAALYHENVVAINQYRSRQRDGWVGLIVAERDRDSKIGHVRVRSGWITRSTERKKSKKAEVILLYCRVGRKEKE